MNRRSRKIRSSGRTSGSVEITLPTELHVLEGVNCRLMVRDGVRPEIILQPDLSRAHAVFEDLWSKLRLGLGESGEIGEFSLADYKLSLFPCNVWQLRPPLSYADALAASSECPGSPSDAAEALSRLLAGLAVGAAYRLGLAATLALAFGDAVAYLLTGVSPGLGTDFERGMAHLAFGENHPDAPLCLSSDEGVWRWARPGLQRVYEEFSAWQQNPNEYESARDKWYRGLQIEVGMSIAASEG
jgi:hypothetical protein